MPTGNIGFEYFGNGLAEVAAEFVNNGFQLHFHTTGDRGVGLALGAIETLPYNDSTLHRLTHCYLVDPDDRGRSNQLGVVADFQLTPSSLARNYERFLEDMICQKRTEQLLPAMEVFKSGSTVVLSSDWDADELSPFRKIQKVLSRAGRGFDSVEMVLPFMTSNAAELLRTNAGILKAGRQQMWTFYCRISLRFLRIKSLAPKRC